MKWYNHGLKVNENGGGRKMRTIQRTEPATSKEVSTLLSEYLQSGGQIVRCPDDKANIQFPRAFPLHYKDGCGKRSGS